MRIISFIILSLIFVSNLYGASPELVTSEVSPELNEIWETKITFGFDGNTLYWYDNDKYHPNHWLKFQLDHKNPPTINKDEIKRISQDMNNKEVKVFTKDKVWVVHYTDDVDGFDWWVSDWSSI